MLDCVVFTLRRVPGGSTGVRRGSGRARDSRFSGTGQWSVHSRSSVTSHTAAGARRVKFNTGPACKCMHETAAAARTTSTRAARIMISMVGELGGSSLGGRGEFVRRRSLELEIGRRRSSSKRRLLSENKYLPSGPPPAPAPAAGHCIRD